VCGPCPPVSRFWSRVLHDPLLLALSLNLRIPLSTGASVGLHWTSPYKVEHVMDFISFEFVH